MIKTIRRVGVVLVAAALTVGLAAVPASAHAVMAPNTATTVLFQTAIRVGHSCEDGSPTTAMRVRIPKGVLLVKAGAVKGWKLKVTRTGTGVPGLGGAVEVAWTGGSLPDHTVQLFPLTLVITPLAPDVLWFPTAQACGGGGFHWNQIPPSVAEWDTVPYPAPYVINQVW